MFFELLQWEKITLNSEQHRYSMTKKIYHILYCRLTRLTKQPPMGTGGIRREGGGHIVISRETAEGGSTKRTATRQRGGATKENSHMQDRGR